MRRYRIYKILVTLLLCAVLVGLFGTRFVWAAMDRRTQEARRMDYEQLTQLMTQRGANPNVVPVVHGDMVQTRFFEPMRFPYWSRSQGSALLGRSVQFKTRTISATHIFKTNFFSVSTYHTGYRKCYSKYGMESLEFLVMRTDQLARLYMRWLTDNDLVAAFKAETGRELTERNAIWALQAVDRELYEHGILMSRETPIPIDTVILASRWAAWLFLPLLIGAFALINRQQTRAAGITPHQQAEAERWAATAARLAQTQPNTSKKADAPISRHPLLEAWCRTAAGYVPRSRRGTVYAELYAHLEDHAEAAGGSDAAAIAAMGDAHEVGRQLRRGEWNWKGILRRLRLTLTQSRWTVCYHGTDGNRYARLHHALSAAGIPFQAEELDAVSRSLGAAYAALPTGANFTDNSPRKQQPPPGAAAKLAMHHMIQQPQDPHYLIRVRLRDLAAAQRLSH